VRLDDALTQISEIRQHMAECQVFRGYRSATTAFTAAVAVAAAAAQARWVPDPPAHLDAYLAVWCAAALGSLVVVGVEMVVRSRRSESALQRQMTLVVVDQFAPSLAAGALLTFVVAEFARQVAWMLPGLWAILFSLGLFASRRFLPRGVFALGGYYLLAGLACLTLDPATQALSPWTMGLVFGVGQALTALFLYFTLERRHGRSK
jgi:hypothetical protein